MPRFKMTYAYARSFPFGPVESGEVIEADENPDGNFFVEEKPAKADKTDKE